MLAQKLMIFFRFTKRERKKEAQTKRKNMKKKTPHTIFISQMGICVSVMRVFRSPSDE